MAGLATVLVPQALAGPEPSCTSGPGPIVCTFAYTDQVSGGPYTWTVPAGVTSITVALDGAQGGGKQNATLMTGGANGGQGAHLVATRPVTPGETLEIRVGGQGAPPSGAGSPASSFFGGGAGGIQGSLAPTVVGGNSGGGGGGASVVLQGSPVLVPILVAGGGGGASAQAFGAGGASGANGQSQSAGGGGAGTGASGGPGGAGSTTDPALCLAYDAGLQGLAGAFLLGGAGGRGGNYGGGGGGGGYFGGGGGGAGWYCNRIDGGAAAGAAGGGGGGSSFTGGGGEAVSNGARAGDGLVTVTYSTSSPVAGTLNASLSTAGATGVNLTAAGTADWAVWGYGTTGTGPCVPAPSPALAPDVRKAGGTNAISPLTNIGSTSFAYSGCFGSANPFSFSWSDGSPSAAVATNSYLGISHSTHDDGDGYSFSVPADTTARRLKVWVFAHNGTGRLTAHLSDGSHIDVVDTGVVGGFNAPGVYTIDYKAGSAAATLTVSWVLTAGFSTANAGIFAVALEGLSAPSVDLVVNSTGDQGDNEPGDGVCDADGEGACTLRAAIEEANAHPNSSAGPDRIVFDIADDSSPTIGPATALPAISDPVDIDGTTQPGYDGDPIVFVDGSDLECVECSTDGLVIEGGGSGSTIEGLAIGGFDGDGIVIEGGDTGSVVTGSWIGFGNVDQQPAANGDDGILILDSSANRIGGPSGAERVVVAGNHGDAQIEIAGNANNNSVQGSYVGISPDGTSDYGTGTGVLIVDGATGNVIGGDHESGEGNFVYGFTDVGVQLESAGTNNRVSGNTIGADPSGDVADAPHTDVDIANTSQTVIGADVDPGGLGDIHPGDGNVIVGAASEEGNSGIEIRSESSGTIVAGNWIGTDRLGTSTLMGNDGGISVHASGNQIGPGNTIAFNVNDGIDIGGTGNRIVANFIHDNGAQGIELYPGGNRNLAAPTLESASVIDVNTVVHGSIVVPSGTASGTSFFVELFLNDACDGVELGGEGQFYATFAEVVTDTSTDGDLTVPFNASVGAVAPGTVVTATSTNAATNDTSKFSNCVTAGASSIAGVAITATPDVFAPSNVPLEGVPPAAFLAGPSSSAQAAPINDVPINDIQLQHSPVNDIPINDVGLTAAAPLLGDVLLSTVPLLKTGGWDAVLSGIPSLKDRPVQNVTLKDVLSIQPTPNDLVGLKLSDLDLSNSPLGKISAVAYGLGDVTLAQLNVDGPTWCTVLAGPPINCTPATQSEVLGRSLLALGIQGAPINDVPINDVPVNDIPVNEIPVNDVPINDIALNGIPVNDVPVNDIPVNDVPVNDIPVNDIALLSNPVNDIPVNDVPVNDVPVNDIPVNEVPINDVPINDIAKTTPINDIPVNDILLHGSPINDIPVNDIGGYPGTLFNNTGCVGTTLGDVKGCLKTGVTLLDLRNAHIGGDLPPSFTLGDVGAWGNATIKDLVAALASVNWPSLGLGDEPSLAQIVGLVKNRTNGAVPTVGDLLALIAQLQPPPTVDVAYLARLFFTDEASLAEMLSLVFQSGDLGWEQLDLRGVGIGQYAAQLLDTDPVTIPAGGSTTVTYTLPAGLRYVPGTTRQIPVAPAGSADLFEDPSVDGQLLVWTLTGAPSSTHRLTFHARPTDAIAAYDVEVAVDGSGEVPTSVTVTLPPGFAYQAGSTRHERVDLDAEDYPDPTVDGDSLTWSLTAAGGTTHHLTFRAFPGIDLGTTLTGASASIEGGEPVDAEPAAVTVNAAPGSGSLAEPQPISSAEFLLSYISSSADGDVYSLPAPAAGSRVTIHLSHLPVDYDLVVYGPNGQVLVPPVPGTPPLDGVALDDPGVAPTHGTDALPAQTLDDVPIDAGRTVVGISANRGTQDDDVTFVSQGGSEPYLIQVSGFNGATSTAPYMVRSEVLPPRSPVSCVPRVYPPNVPGTSASEELAGVQVPAGVNTLFVVNARQLVRIYGASAAASTLTALGNFHPTGFPASVMQVDAQANTGVNAAYDAWDACPGDPSLANGVVTAVNARIALFKQAHPTVQYVVLVGDDGVIPFARLDDRTTLSNEDAFAGTFSAALPLGGALSQSKMLSDDPYGTLVPVPFFDRQLFVPELGVGRLVETPAQISAQLAAFGDGHIAGGSALTTGYDFLKDGADAVSSALAPVAGGNPVAVPGGPNTTLLDPPTSWSAGNLGAALQASGGQQAQLVSINAHADDSRFQAADQSLFTTADVLAGSLTFSGRIVFSMGCHAGLNVPNDFLPPRSRIDWAEYFASKGASIYAANTGFGYGDSDIVAYSEDLNARFAANLAAGMTAGEAFADAKSGFQGDLGLVGVYDEKAMAEFTLYGLPMASIAGAHPASAGFTTLSHAAASVGAQVATTATLLATTSTDPVTGLTVEDFTVTDADLTGRRHSSSDNRGDYYKGRDGTLVTHLRPIEPKATQTIETPNAHGALITSLTSTDVSGFDALFARPLVDSKSTEPEIGYDDVAFPAKLQTVTSVRSFGGARKQKLILAQGQFFSQDPTDGDQTGFQRLFTHIDGKVFTSSSPDYAAPVFRSVEAVKTDDLVAFTVDADAGTGDSVRRVLVAYKGQGAGSTPWSFVDLIQDGASNRWSASGPIGAGAFEYFVQTVDSHGNVGVSTNKGIYYEEAKTPPPLGGVAIVPTSSPTDGWFDGSAALVVQVDGQAPPAGTTVTVDGVVQPYSPPIEVTGDGVHTIVATTPAGSATRILLVDSGPPAITISSATDGGVYLQGQPVTADFGCLDAGIGTLSCGGVITESSLPRAVGDPIPTSTAGTFHFTVTGEDKLHKTATKTVTYTVVEPLKATLAGTIGLGGWYTSPVTVTVESPVGQPPEHGTVTTKLDAAAPLPYSGPVVVSTDGMHSMLVSGPFGSSKTLTFKIDRSHPTVTSIVRAAPSPTKVTSLPFTVTFSEPVTGVTAGAFTATSANVTGILPGVGTPTPVGPVPASVWTVPVSTVGAIGANNGSVRLDLTGVGSIIDAAGNSPVVPFLGPVYAFDTTPPGLTITLAAGQVVPVASPLVHFAAVFTEPVTGFDLTDVVLGGTASIAGATVSVTGSGATYDIAVSGAAGSGTLTTSVAAARATDQAGNGNTAASGGTTVAIVSCLGVPPVGAIVGGAGDTTINGTSGNDVIYDLSGNNKIDGKGGNDRICTGPGNDKITTGSGTDVVTDTGGANTVDTGGGADQIVLGNGNDKVTAGDGDDAVLDSGGVDTIDTGGGNDRVASGTGVDQITTGDGDDAVTDTGGANTINTGAGADQVTAGTGVDQILTGDGNDAITDAGGANTIDSGAGNDQVNTGTGVDSITTGVGDDVVTDGGGANSINTGAGADKVTAGTGADAITTGDGNDIVTDAGGQNTIDLGAGNDNATTGTGDDVIQGGTGDDTINAGNGNNTVNAGDGNDTITTGTGNDSIDGGAGRDSCNPGAGNNKVKNCEF